MYPKKTNKLSGFSQGGFSLIEVVLVILALGVLFLPVLHYFFGMSKSATDSWSSVKAAEAGQTLLAEIRGTPSDAVMDWNGRTDKVGLWTRTVQIDYIVREGEKLIVSAVPTNCYRVKVILKKAGSNDITFSSLIKHEFPVM